VVTDDVEEIFARSEIEVVDLVLHPEPRLAMIRRALESDKHVLSQKPFVTDIREGRKLVELAEESGRKLAVNQNGRWAPYFSYLRQVLKQGLLGEIVSCDIHIAWDHTWIKGTRFEQMHHIVLYDFAIHWFDIVTCVFGERRPRQVFARTERALGQELDPPLSAGALVGFDGGQASLVFHAGTRFDPSESTVVTGTKGTFRSSGPVCANNRVLLTTAEGQAQMPLQGAWFNDGFAGAMGELLCAIEENREPENSARNNLRSLELCFAAVASADSGQPVNPGDVLEIVP
jgi:predicted dehydrogenase